MNLKKALKNIWKIKAQMKVLIQIRNGLRKNLKKEVSTDNGFDIKADLTDFEDPMKYSVRQNPDGSIDIVIKNVRFYEEK